MLSIATGHDVGYLTGAVAGGREGYYTGAVDDDGEPAGLWYGAGAAALGLDGEVNADLMEAVYSRLLDPRDPATHRRESWAGATPLAAGHRAYRGAEEIYAGLLDAHPDAGPEQRAELRAQAERSARQAVSFIDVTFSVPKSVTVLGVSFERMANDARAAGDDVAADAWAQHAKAVEDAALAGSRAALDFLQDQAGYSRAGHHGGGAGRWVDAHEFVVAQFLQHDSRDHDPQLHVHNAILNRVRCADGTWRSLDSRAIHTMRAAAGAIGERVMEAHLTRSLGVRFETRPDGRAREVIGVPQASMDLFSSRRRALTGRAAETINEFRARYGRDPSPAERFHIAQQATLSTRAAKQHHGETRAQQLDRWTTQCHDRVAGGLARIAHDVLERGQNADTAATFSPQDVTARALAAAAETKQAWTRSTLIRAISDALPGNLRIAPDEIRALLENLADQALTDAVPVTMPAATTNLPPSELLADGRSPYASPSGQLFTVAGQLSAEHALRAAAVTRGAARFTDEQAERLLADFAAAGRTLSTDQLAAVRGILSSGAMVEVLSAAPGTGKSYVVGTLADAWSRVDGRRVFGLTPSQVAATVLAEEGVSAAANTSAWLGAQQRLQDQPPGVPDRFGDEAWRLRRDDLVVVDEANMASTEHLAEIQRRCAAAGAKLLLTGDPAQLGAVGPAGALADVAEHGIRYELAEVRRFDQQWERTASLRLREGDASVLAEYDKHGRLRSAGTTEQAEREASRAWLGDTLAGRESLLMVRDNAAAARVSATLRAELVELGRVEESGVALGRDDWQGVVAGVGDLVQARRNGRELVGFEGNTTFPVNRQTYRVTAVRPDGGLTVAPITGRADNGETLGDPLQLPAGYVDQDLTLGYASTVHAAEGRTVDTAHSVVGPGTDLAGVLVPLTRGRECNTAWVITRQVSRDAETGETHSIEERSARAVLADVLETAEADRSATAQREQADLDARSTATHVDQLVDVVARHVSPGRTTALFDKLTAEGLLPAEHRTGLAADEAFGSLEQLLRRAELAGHQPEAVVRAALAGPSLDDARSPAQVLHYRITTALTGRLTSRVTSAADLIPRDAPTEWLPWLHDRADAADARRHELGTQTATEQPRWAIEALGPVPEDVLARQDWEHRAGWAAAYRELTGHTDDTDPLGAAPPRGLPEQSALFRTAHDALRLVDAGAEEAELTEGQLRARHHALVREEAWAPSYVADQLAATQEQAAQHRTDADIWAARADVTSDPDEAARLRAAAAKASERADQLGERAAALETADEARGQWYTHTAATRDKAVRARAELHARGIDPDSPDDRVTAEEWLDIHRAEQAEADQYREIRDEHDFADHELADHEAGDHEAGAVAGRRQLEAGRPRLEADVEAALETPVPDVREASIPDAGEHRDPAERRRVLTADETAEAVGRAQSALSELAARHQLDTRADDETGRQEELSLWNHEERTAETESAHERSDEPAFER